MSDNLSLWNKVARPPAEVLKRITGGRLTGMTDISPQWRIKIMTEVFGSVGDGWAYTIDRLWTEPGSDGQVCAFAQVSVRYKKSDGEWSEPVQGIGGSMLIANEKNGPYTSDEAYKMAVTDALSVALKALGTAADIYLGLWDGSKYRDPEPDDTEDDLESAVKEIERTETEQKLREVFSLHYKAAKTDRTRGVIVEAKDRQKAVLQEIEDAATN